MQAHCEDRTCHIKSPDFLINEFSHAEEGEEEEEEGTDLHEMMKPLVEVKKV